MQASEASKTSIFLARIGRANLVWGLIFATLLLSAGGLWLWTYRDLPTATWRDANTDLPWESPTLTVNNVSAQWLSAKGHERMELRAAYYPAAQVSLGEGQGSGVLYIRFTDSQGRLAGNVICLQYKDGAFLPLSETNIEAAGKSARVHVETGFANEDSFTLHRISEHQPLWRVTLSCSPEGSSQAETLGFVTIPAVKGGQS